MNRKVIFLLTVIFLVSPLYAVGFGYHILEIRTDVDFSGGVFPVSAVYQFNFPVPDFARDCRTEIAFRLDSGLDFRTLRQNPDDGSFFAQTGSPEYPTDYTTIFDEFSLFISQGFSHRSWSDKDLITVKMALDGRWEQSYESLSWMRNSDNLNGLFVYSDGSSFQNRFENSGFIGAPDLAGNRITFNLIFSVYASIDFMRETRTKRDGVKLEGSLRLVPSWMPLSIGRANYLYAGATLSLAKTIWSLDKEGSQENLTWFSAVIDDKFTYRAIGGNSIPYYIQGGDIWGSDDVPNTAHAITNRLSVSIYGPQVRVTDVFPSITLFWDTGIALGRALNSESETGYFESVGSIGLIAEMIIWGACELYIEYGYVYDAAFVNSPHAEFRFGFKVGV